MITLKTAGAMTALRLLAGFGGPTLAVAALVAVIVVGALCWAIADTGRAERLALLIHVTRSGSWQQPQRRRRHQDR